MFAPSAGITTSRPATPAAARLRLAAGSENSGLRERAGAKYSGAPISATRNAVPGQWVDPLRDARPRYGTPRNSTLSAPKLSETTGAAPEPVAGRGGAVEDVATKRGIGAARARTPRGARSAAKAPP